MILAVGECHIAKARNVRTVSQLCSQVMAQSHLVANISIATGTKILPSDLIGQQQIGGAYAGHENGREFLTQLLTGYVFTSQLWEKQRKHQ